MDIWQGTRVIGSTSWESFANVQVFANADNSFTVTTAARPDGSSVVNQTSTVSWTLLTADVDAFGFSPLDALQSFSFNFAGQTLPWQLPSYLPGVGIGFSTYRHPDGTWTIAGLFGSTTSTTWEYETVVARFGTNRVLTQTVSLGYSFEPDDLEFIDAENGFYTLNNGAEITYFLQPTRDLIRTATFNTGTGLTNTGQIAFVLEEGRQLYDSTTIWTTQGGDSRVYWVEHVSGSNTLNVRFINVDAAGAATSGPVLLWSGTSQAYSGIYSTRSDDRIFVAWTVGDNSAGGAANDDILIAAMGPGGTTILSLAAAFGVPAFDLFGISQIIALANNNIALLWVDGFETHVTILSPDGVKLDDFYTTELDVGRASITELSDGRIALVGPRDGTFQDNYTSPELISIILDPRPDVIWGTDAADFIIGKTGKAETIHGGLGNDRLYTVDGGGILFGEGGDDDLFGGEGVDYLYGGDNTDDLFGRENNDELDGGAGDDNLHGDSGTDYLYGGVGSDHIWGGSETDFIWGDEGADFLYGEGGYDVFYGGEGADAYDGGTETDAVNYFYSTSSVGIYLNMNLAGIGDALGDTFTSIETFYLSNHDDIANMAYATGRVSIWGNGGRDQIVGSQFGSSILGGADSDVFYLIGGANTVWGDDSGGPSAIDYLSLQYSPGSLNIDMAAATSANTYFTFLFNGQTQYVYGDVEALIGSGFDDRIFGNAFDNILSGNGGRDTLNGRGGRDQLLGNNGDDLIYFDPNDDLDMVLGGADTDTLYAYDMEAPLDFNLFNHQFEIALVAEVDHANAAWTTNTWHYDQLWRRFAQYIVFDDGTALKNGFDMAGLLDWKEDYVNDVLTRFTNYDQDGTEGGWTYFYDLFSAGMKTQRFVQYDNGTSQREGFDSQMRVIWRQEYDTANQLVRYTEYDRDDLLDWDNYYNLYVNGVRTQQYMVNDDGTATRNGYDAQGRLDWVQEYRTNGNLSRYVDYDQATDQPWQYAVTYYDVNGAQTSRYILYDDGSELYL